MSASKANSSAKMRGGGTRPQTTGKTPTFLNKQEDTPGSNLVQVTPIQMLKIHEARITSIESAAKKTNVVVSSNPLIDTLYEELSASKKEAKELEKTVQELKTTIFTIQSIVLATSQSLSKMKDDIDLVKKDFLSVSKPSAE